MDHRTVSRYNGYICIVSLTEEGVFSVERIGDPTMSDFPYSIVSYPISSLFTDPLKEVHEVWNGWFSAHFYTLATVMEYAIKVLTEGDILHKE